MPIDYHAVDLDAVESYEVTEHELSTLNVIGHHCTRAIRTEIERIGLRPLSIEQHTSYVKRKLVECGLDDENLHLFSRSVRNYLSSAQCCGREGRLWFCLNRSLFEDDDGCLNMFRFFGGESIYRPFTEGAEFASIREALSSIGQPLLITAKIPLRSIPSFQRDRIVDVLLQGEPRRCEAYVSDPINSADIISITPWGGSYGVC